MRARIPALAAIVAMALLVGACTVTVLPDDGSTVVRPTPPTDVPRPPRRRSRDLRSSCPAMPPSAASRSVR
jgi:hypothetical protein